MGKFADGLVLKQVLAEPCKIYVCQIDFACTFWEPRSILIMPFPIFVKFLQIFVMAVLKFVMAVLKFVMAVLKFVIPDLKTVMPVLKIVMDVSRTLQRTKVATWPSIIGERQSSKVKYLQSIIQTKSFKPFKPSDIA